MGNFVIDQPRPKGRKKIIIPIAILLVLTGLMILIIRSLNSPAEGTVSQTSPEDIVTADPYASPATYNGKYISFTYPAHYKPVASKLSGNFLEGDTFYGTADKSKQLTVEVIRESLSDDSGIVYRRQHSELYRQTQSAAGALIFSGLDGHEITAYLQHAGLVASIATSSSNLSDLTADSQTAVNSLRWK